MARDLQDAARARRRQTSTPSGERNARGRAARESIASLDREQGIRIRFEEEAADSHPNRVEVRDLYAKFVTAYPRHRRGLDLYLQDSSLKAEAPAAGVSVSALSQARAKALRAFQAWAQRGGLAT